MTLFARKLRLLASYPSAVRARPRQALRYLLLDRETTNLTYDIANEDELAAFLAASLGRSMLEIESYLDEARDDAELASRLARRLRAHGERNPEPRFGRRLGWYVVVRCLQPALVVETGVHDGLGSALILRALELNAREGRPGRLSGFDLDPKSGWLVEGVEGFELVVGDVRTTLSPSLAGREVGVFIHDSLHAYEHELFEYSVAFGRRADPFALISDNAHATSALADFCRDRELRYSLFVEQPRDHFYPGAGLGLGLSGWRE